MLKNKTEILQNVFSFFVFHAEVTTFSFNIPLLMPTVFDHVTLYKSNEMYYSNTGLLAVGFISTISCMMKVMTKAYLTIAWQLCNT